MRTISLLAISLLVGGCDGAGANKSADRGNASSGSSSGATGEYRSPQGVPYRVERVSGISPDRLPMNSDLKMADGDLAKYAPVLCTLDVPAATAPARCDVYVQPDAAGTLIGYAAIIEDSRGVSFATTTTLNDKKQPGGGNCYLGGMLAGAGEDWKNPIRDAGKDFTGQFAYLAWEKDPGNWVITPMGDDNDGAPANASGGMWYVEKKGDKLRIYQERWNYCYKNSSINVDDVYYQAVSLIRI